MYEGRCISGQGIQGPHDLGCAAGRAHLSSEHRSSCYFCAFSVTQHPAASLTLEFLICFVFNGRVQPTPRN